MPPPCRAAGVRVHPLLLRSFYKPLRDFYGVGRRRSLQGVHSARRICAGDDRRGHDSRNIHRRTEKGGVGGWEDDGDPETWGVLQMLRDETLRGLLVIFCEQSLCGESVDFLVDVAINYESLAQPEEQFRALTRIVESYLAQGSANEVNVSNAYRNAAAVWLTKRDEFFALEWETRTHILDRQRDEIAKVWSWQDLRWLSMARHVALRMYVTVLNTTSGFVVQEEVERLSTMRSTTFSAT